jgi:hypothetical protein
LCGRWNFYFAANSLPRRYCLDVFWADQLETFKLKIHRTFE